MGRTDEVSGTGGPCRPLRESKGSLDHLELSLRDEDMAALRLATILAETRRGLASEGKRCKETTSASASQADKM